MCFAHWSRQSQAFHANILGHNDTKECLRGRSSNLVLKSVHVQEARGVRDRLTLSALCWLLCVRVCLPQLCHLFFIWLASTLFPLCLFFSLHFSRQLCLFHVLFCFIVYTSRSCAADFYHFHTLFFTRQLFLLCLLTHYLNDDFQLGPGCVCVCVRDSVPVCFTPAHVWDCLETGNNGCESHALKKKNFKRD